MNFEPEVYYYNLILYWKRIVFDSSNNLKDIRENVNRAATLRLLALSYGSSYFTGSQK